MTVSVNSISLFAEVFPVKTSTIPKLRAYNLDTRGGDLATIGGKLAYRLRRELSGHWVWTGNRIATDIAPDSALIHGLVQKLWAEQPEVFRDLIEVREDPIWKSSLQSQAEFVARGLFQDIDKDVRRLLSDKGLSLGNATIERIYEQRGWTVQGSPAVSISVFSRLAYKEPLNDYARKVIDARDLEGLLVADRTSTMKGEIVGISGKVEDHRRRLLTITQREEMQEIIQNADGNELVVRVASGRNEYDYAVSALRIILRIEDLARFHIDSGLALKTLRIEPERRCRLVMAIAKIAQSKGLIGGAYSSKEHQSLFSHETGADRRMRFGSDSVFTYDDRALLRNLRNSGLYRISDRFQSDPTLRIGIVDAVASRNKSGFLASLERELKLLGFSLAIAEVEKLDRTTRLELERAVEGLARQNLDLLLAFLPEETTDDEEEWGSYHRFKSLTVGQGIPGQAVFESTIDNKYAMGNIVLGMLGKTGNIPFVLADRLSYADLVVGIDIARRKKARLPGSVSATAIARIYFGNGEFVRYVIHDAPLEGETVPENVLQSLFPIKDFEGKRVVVHRDGYFRGGEKQALLAWARKIGATFHLVEVLKSGTPRLYGLAQDTTVQAPKGSAFVLSRYEGFLVSSPPPFLDATAQPLRIRSEPPFSVEQAIDSVLSLTLLHYGSLRPPKLPVTIHYSDKIAYLALMGIKPKDLEGRVPYWL